MNDTAAKSIDHKALFVSGLNEKVEFNDLQQHFEPYGKIVLARVLKDAKTGLSRRIGYVNFEEESVAAVALQATNKRPGPLSDEPITVKFAERDPTYKAIETTRVFIRFIPIETTTEQIREAFSRYGEVDEVTVEADHTRPQKKGPTLWSYAYVRYTNSRDANLAVSNAAREIQWGNRPLTVKPAEGEETRRLRAAHRLSAFSTPTPTVMVGVPRGVTSPLSPSNVGAAVTDHLTLPPPVAPGAVPLHAPSPSLYAPGAVMPTGPYYQVPPAPTAFHQHSNYAAQHFLHHPHQHLHHYHYQHHHHHHVASASPTPMMTFVPGVNPDPTALAQPAYYMMPSTPQQQPPPTPPSTHNPSTPDAHGFQVIPMAMPWGHALPSNSYLLPTPVTQASMPLSPPY